jgi:hypothetical protein
LHDRWKAMPWEEVLDMVKKHFESAAETAAATPDDRLTVSGTTARGLTQLLEWMDGIESGALGHWLRDRTWRRGPWLNVRELIPRALAALPVSAGGASVARGGAGGGGDSDMATHAAGGSAGGV